MKTFYSLQNNLCKLSYKPLFLTKTFKADNSKQKKLKSWINGWPIFDAIRNYDPILTEIFKCSLTNKRTKPISIYDCLVFADSSFCQKWAKTVWGHNSVWFQRWVTRLSTILAFFVLRYQLWKFLLTIQDYW